MSDSNVARPGNVTVAPFVILLLIVVALLVGVRWLLTPHPEQRNFEFFPDMATSPAVESQSLAAMLPQGLSHQPRVAGVVPRGHVPFHYGSDDAEAKRAGRELSNPFAKDDAARAERGAHVYAVHCTPCHDAEGGGHGAAVLRGMLQPPLLQAVNAVQMKDGEMFHLLTVGRGNMPALGDRIPAADRWAAILHVRALQAAPPPVDDGAPGDEDSGSGQDEEDR